MLRRIALARGKPLKRTAFKRSAATLARGVLQRTAMKSKPRRRSTKPLRASLPGRSHGWCEMQIPDVCTGQATEPAHRNGSKSGGRHGDGALVNDRSSNVLHSDWACHRWQTATAANRQVAEANGWVLREDDDPLTRRVLYRGQWVLLDDDWNVTPCG